MYVHAGVLAAPPPWPLLHSQQPGSWVERYSNPLQLPPPLQLALREPGGGSNDGGGGWELSWANSDGGGRIPPCEYCGFSLVYSNCEVGQI